MSSFVPWVGRKQERRSEREDGGDESFHGQDDVEQFTDQR